MTIGEPPGVLPINQVLTLYLLGEDSVLFSKRSRQLYGLDRVGTAALLWLSAGESPDPTVAPALLEQIVALLSGDEEAYLEFENDFPCPLQPPPVPTALPRFRLLSTRFVVQGPASLLRQWIMPYLSPLQAEDDNAVELLISVEPEAAGWDLIFNGVPQGESLRAQQLLPLLHDRLRKFAYQRQEYLLAVHAAVLCKEGRSLLLPGQAGFGKSTLAAALLSRGFRLFSDEVALIDGATGGVVPLPLGLGLKRGSWPGLANLYPQLQQQPIHIRRDDKEIRYLLPGPESSAGVEEMARATCLVFPTYRPGAAAELTHLRPGQGLRFLTEAGYQVSSLDEAKVEKILHWITGLKCYTLTYATTAEALCLLEPILDVFSSFTPGVSQPNHAV